VAEPSAPKAIQAGARQERPATPRKPLTLAALEPAKRPGAASAGTEATSEAAAPPEDAGSGPGPGAGSGPGPGPGARAAEDVAPEAVRAAYLEALKQRVLASPRSYPLAARRLHLEGDVVLEFRVRPDGSLEWVRAAASSGSGVLDEAAVAFVLGLAPFEAFPDELPQIPLDLRLTLDYRLAAAR